MQVVSFYLLVLEKVLLVCDLLISYYAGLLIDGKPWMQAQDLSFY